MLGSERGQEKNSSCELVERIKSSVRSYNQFIFFSPEPSNLKHVRRERSLIWISLDSVTVSKLMREFPNFRAI